MKVTKVYEKGVGQINEDAYSINNGAALYAVMDGATGLEGIPGYVASQAVQKVLDTSDGSSLLMERIKTGNDQIQDAMMRYGARGREDEFSISNIKATERSTTGIAAIQFDENRTFLTYVHAGDCMIFLQYENGTIRTLTHDVVQYLDQQAIREVQRLRKMPEAENVQIESYVAKIKPTLIENRKKMNTNDGYSVLDGSAEAMKHVEYGKVSLKRVRNILLLTDGLQMPVQEGEEGTWEKAASVAFDQGIDSLRDIVTEKERADANGVQYPRLKRADDKTGILLEFDKE